MNWQWYILGPWLKYGPWPAIWSMPRGTVFGWPYGLSNQWMATILLSGWPCLYLVIIRESNILWGWAWLAIWAVSQWMATVWSSADSKLVRKSNYLTAQAMADHMSCKPMNGNSMISGWLWTCQGVKLSPGPSFGWPYELKANEWQQCSPWLTLYLPVDPTFLGWVLKLFLS